MSATVGKRVRSFMRSARKAHFARGGAKVDPQDPVLYFEETCLNGTPYMVPLVILRTRPCRWFSSGGCVMCNYELLAVDEGASDDDVLSQADRAIEKLGGDLTQYPYILLTSQGSFLDDHEINPELRLRLLDRFRSAGLRAISTESEARYCTNVKSIVSLRNAFPGEISIGIGLEAADDFVRNDIINKGLPLHVFKDAASVLRRTGVNFYTYISLGKPFLTPSEDVSDAVEAVELTARNGGFMSVLEMINIQPYTLTESLWRASLYEPANLWRGVDVLTRLPAEIRSRISVKGFEADVAPVPLALPASCRHCQDRLTQGLNQWNLTREFAELLASAGQCDCREELDAGSIDVALISMRANRALAQLAQ